MKNLQKTNEKLYGSRRHGEKIPKVLSESLKNIENYFTEVILETTNRKGCREEEQ